MSTWMTLVSPACFIWASMSLTLLDSKAGVVPFNFAKSSCSRPTGPAIFSLLAFQASHQKNSEKQKHHVTSLTPFALPDFEAYAIVPHQGFIAVSLLHVLMPFQAASLPQGFPTWDHPLLSSFPSHGTSKNSSAFGRSRRVKGSWDLPEQSSLDAPSTPFSHHVILMLSSCPLSLHGWSSDPMRNTQTEPRPPTVHPSADAAVSGRLGALLFFPQVLVPAGRLSGRA